jgi:hypothetical protein
MPKDGKGCHAHWIIGAGREKAWRKFACASRAFRLVMTSGPAKRGNRERPSHWSTRKPKRPQRLPSGPSQLPTQPSQAKQSQSAIVAQAATPARDSPESPILTPIGRKSACVMCGDVPRTRGRATTTPLHCIFHLDPPVHATLARLAHY